MLTLCFVGLASLCVPRLVNCIWSDGEFTGWVSPIAQRVAGGERIFRDFTLPIPPGSFLLLAAIQRVLGRALLLDELWLCAACQLGMVWVGFWFVRRLTSTRPALLATICTAPILITTPKEIAYDQTAQLVAWTSLAVLACALSQTDTIRRRRWLVAAGATAAFTLLFKSSTGLGAVGGVLLGVVALTAVVWIRQGRSALRPVALDWAWLGGGLALGAAVTSAIVVGAGGSFAEFFRTVFIDGPALKGGTGRAMGNLLSFTVFQHPVHVSIVTGVLLGYLLLRLAGQADAFSPTTDRSDSPDRANAVPSSRFTVAVCLLVVVTYGVGMALLIANAAAVPLPLRMLEKFGTVPRMASLLFLMVLLVGNLKAARGASDRPAVFVAVVLAAGSQSLMHNLSWPELRPYYDNNPIIPLGIAALIIVLARARTPVLTWGAVTLLLLGLFGAKFQRYLDANNPVDDPGFWRGLRVSGNGQTIVRVAKRVRELTGPDDTVLMLPEDPKVGALIGRPRPRLFGAIIFVDQFPAHAARRDWPALLAAPPKVLILHPRTEDHWRSLYERWSRSSPAGRFQKGFLDQHLESHYQHDSSYPTWFFNRPSTLDVYVRKPAGWQSQPARAP